MKVSIDISESDIADLIQRKINDALKMSSTTGRAEVDGPVRVTRICLEALMPSRPCVLRLLVEADVNTTPPGTLDGAQHGR